MRIISLLPAATEWVAAFGASGDLVGRSHACDHPAEVQALPVVTQPALPVSTGSRAIDEAVHARVSEGLSLYHVDTERLRSLRPDLILTQAQCEVCGVSLTDVEEALSGWTSGQPVVFSMEPLRMKHVLDAALRLGQRIGQGPAAMQWIAAAERRLQLLRSSLGFDKRTDPMTYPSMACIEWIDPLMVAGHWMPDLADLAGVRAVLSRAGAPSGYVPWEAILEADPAYLAVMPCGYSIEQTRQDITCLTRRPGWNELKAVQAGRVFLFDGNAYFNRPGPRLYRSVELLAAAVYGARPGIHTAPIAPWEMQALG